MTRFAKIQLLFTAEYIDERPCDLHNSTEYANCLLDTFERSRPYYNQGIPEVNLPPMDPYFLPHAKINHNVNELVKINADIKNMKVTGFATSIIESLK